MQKVIASRSQDLTYRAPADTVVVFTHISVDAEYLDLARVGFEYIPQNVLEASRAGWTLNETAIPKRDLDDMIAQGVDSDDAVRVTRGLRRDIPHDQWDAAEMIINKGA